jgi:hypothetical protein
MTNSDYPWEPPLAGTETEHLIGTLDRLRTTFRWKTDNLDEAGLRTRVGASSLTLGSLLKHLAFVEAFYSRLRLNGESPGAPWETVDFDAEPDWVFTSAEKDTPEELYRLWDDAVAFSRTAYDAAILDGGLDQHVKDSYSDDRHASLRRILFDLVEEYGRHTGHADLLRETVDGVVGEDPPARWEPRGAAKA